MDGHTCVYIQNKRKNVQALTKDQQICDVIAPDAPCQGADHWGRIMAHVLFDSAQGVLFEILTTRMIRMVRTVIMEYSLCEAGSSG